MNKKGRNLFKLRNSATTSIFCSNWAVKFPIFPSNYNFCVSTFFFVWNKFRSVMILSKKNAGWLPLTSLLFFKTRFDVCCFPLLDKSTFYMLSLGSNHRFSPCHSLSDAQSIDVPLCLAPILSSLWHKNSFREFLTSMWNMWGMSESENSVCY